MISGAVYREGVARTSDGATYIYGISSSAVVPTTAQGRGAMIPAGLAVNDDGAIYARFV